MHAVNSIADCDQNAADRDMVKVPQSIGQAALFAFLDSFVIATIGQ